METWTEPEVPRVSKRGGRVFTFNLMVSDSEVKKNKIFSSSDKWIPELEKSADMHIAVEI